MAERSGEYYIKTGVSRTEYECSKRVARLGLAPRVLRYDEDGGTMAIEAGKVLDGFPIVMPDQLAADIAGLALRIARAGVFHNDFHAGNMVYMGRTLMAIDWEECPSSAEDEWLDSACQMVNSFVRNPWIDRKRRGRTTAALAKGREKVRAALNAQIRQITGCSDYRCVDTLAEARKHALAKRRKSQSKADILKQYHRRCARKAAKKAKKAEKAEAVGNATQTGGKTVRRGTRARVRARDARGRFI